MTNRIGSKWDVVFFSGGVKGNGRRVARRKDARLGSPHVVVYADRAIFDHIKLAGKEIGARQESNTQDRIFCLEGSFFGDDADTLFAWLKCGNFLAERQRYTVRFVHFFELSRDFFVEVLGQNARECVDKRNFFVYVAQLFCELSANIAGTDDDDRLGILCLLFDFLCVTPVFAEKHVLFFDAGDRRNDGLRTSGNNEVVKVKLVCFVRLEIGPAYMLSFDICRCNIAGHVHVRARFFERGRRGIKHLVGIAYVLANPKSNTA